MQGAMTTGERQKEESPSESFEQEVPEKQLTVMAAAAAA